MGASTWLPRIRPPIFPCVDPTEPDCACFGAMLGKDWRFRGALTGTCSASLNGEHRGWWRVPSLRVRGSYQAVLMVSLVASVVMPCRRRCHATVDRRKDGVGRVAGQLPVTRRRTRPRNLTGTWPDPWGSPHWRAPEPLGAQRQRGKGEKLLPADVTAEGNDTLGIYPPSSPEPDLGRMTASRGRPRDQLAGDPTPARHIRMHARGPPTTRNGRS
jgi:hypothetical protein